MGRLDVFLAWNCSSGEASCRFVERQVPLELFLSPPLIWTRSSSPFCVSWL